MAIELASRAENREKIRAVVVENTFTSVPEIARSAFDVKVIRILPDILFKNQYRSRRKVCRVSAPTLFLSGADDQLIPPRMMRELFVGCGAEIKRLVPFKKGGHNDTWMCNNYYAAFRFFLDEVVLLRDIS